tara:strand:- start:10796 stop:15202 length:4407 start_codon:yes stop_codon:yes gene_type:complete
MGVNKHTPKSRNYTKTNFVELIELITPEVYQQKDLELSGTELNPISDLINRHVQLAENVSTVLSISGVENTQTSSLENISGISQYFVKQNELTNINPFILENKILQPLGESFVNYSTSSAFETYLSSTLIPLLVPASQTKPGSLEDNITTLSALTGNSDASSVHNYLVDSLGWFYFLNTSADGGLDYSPSSYVLESFNSLYLGKTLTTIDGVKGLTEYLWRNTEACSFGQYLPQSFVSGTSDSVLDSSAGVVATYTSGIQKLENLQTLIDVVYSPLYIDQRDYRVKDAFDSYINSQVDLDDLVTKGPHRKFSNLLGYHFADISDQIENISLIYDIENTKAEQLQYIADLIGFKLRGNSPTKWRHQLRLAIDLYKKSGTLESIQSALNALIIDSVFDVSGKVQELWESYIPNLIWYALVTESPLFKNLETWTPALATEGGVYNYSVSSLEENLKIVTDSIILDMYKKFPENFLFHGDPFPVPEFWELDLEGCDTKRYTIVGEPAMRGFHIHKVTDPGFQAYKQDAKLFGESKAWDAAYGSGPLGEGVYMAGIEHPTTGRRPVYLNFKGDLEFLYNYRGRRNFPMPPFEEVKYYRDCSVTKPMVDFLVERLKCFKVKDSFAEETGNYIVSSAVTDESDLGALNEFLMFFSSTQTPSNFDSVMLSISDYEKNALSLWNGKSSHLFINFKDTDFDFSKTTLEGDGKYALYEAARVSREFSPAHAITRVNLTASAQDDFDMSSTAFEYLGLDHDDTRVGYTSGSVLGNFEYSGVAMSFAAGGGDDDRGSDGGRGGLNTFKRSSADDVIDPLLSGIATITPLDSVSRRALRRRNLKYLLPLEGYYDRTGFNGPVSYDPSTLEHSLASSLGELTLGYIASAGKFHPVVDPVNPSGVWDECEGLMSSRTFSGVDTSTTFPYRGLSALGSNAKMPEVLRATARYVDRGQLPELYNTMHELFEAKALDNGDQILLNTSAYDEDSYWKNNAQSLANEAIASGYVLNEFADYQNFKFGKELHKLHREYSKYFAKHPLGGNSLEKTGGNIFGQVYGLGLFNCDLQIDGEFVSDFVASSIRASEPINRASVWNDSADGTLEVTAAGQSIVPLSGTFTAGNVNNAELRNPKILSGIEFCDISGAPSANQFSIFDIDSSFSIPGEENALIGNRVIKCKSLGGLPRLRFDLSSYGDRRNYFIKDHLFSLKVKSLVAEEFSEKLGGGQLGVWIHTEPVDDLMWVWTPNKKWQPINESRLSRRLVLNNLCHKYDFIDKRPDPSQKTNCLANVSRSEFTINNVSLNNIKDSYFETFQLDFDTRNFTIHNNYEYLDIIPVQEEQYKITEQVNRDDTNYIVEIFFVPNNNDQKYLLLDSIELQDNTLRGRASIGTGHGVETKGIPFTPFVKEDRLELSKDQLRDVLKFYNGLMGQGIGQYATNLASRDASITEGSLELSGGSRLNYKVNPEWVKHTNGSNDNYTEVEFDN